MIVHEAERRHTNNLQNMQFAEVCPELHQNYGFLPSTAKVPAYAGGYHQRAGIWAFNDTLASFGCKMASGKPHFDPLCFGLARYLNEGWRIYGTRQLEAPCLIPVSKEEEKIELKTFTVHLLRRTKPGTP